MGGDNGSDRGKMGKGHGGTCVKDPWTKPKGGRSDGDRWGVWGRGNVVG